MNNNMETSNSQNVGSYKATGNLNTMISNPSANINDTMNINIQNIQNNVPQQNVTNQQQSVLNNVNNEDIQNVQNSNNNINNNINNNVNIQNNESIPENINNNEVKNYVSVDNKKQKKTISLNMGSEFRIALLIVILLLVFIFLLPLIPTLFRG